MPLHLVHHLSLSVRESVSCPPEKTPGRDICPSSELLMSEITNTAGGVYDFGPLPQLYKLVVLWGNGALKPLDNDY